MIGPSWQPPPAPMVFGARTSEAAVLLVAHDSDSSPAAGELLAQAAAIGVSVPQLRAMWQRVAVCEVGGNWAMVGPVFSGIGFANATWQSFGGAQFAPVAGRATRDEQIVVGMRVTGGWVPDQSGCAAW